MKHQQLDTGMSAPLEQSLRHERFISADRQFEDKRATGSTKIMDRSSSGLSQKESSKIEQ
jgi:hypothetical protein